MESTTPTREAALNVLCGICSEFYTSNDRIYVTRCGHVFHQYCLFQWLSMSHTCPQCRDSCLRHQCNRLYLNFEPPTVNEGAIALNPPPLHSNGYDWIPIDPWMEEEIIKTFAFHFGTNENGDNIYAARTYCEADLVPCYYCPTKGGAIVPWGFKSHLIKRNIEVLDISCDNAEYQWIAASNGDLPDNALVSGHTIRNEPLYTARFKHNGIDLYGKLHRQYDMAYVPYQEKELCNTQYEVLVRIPKDDTGKQESSS